MEQKPIAKSVISVDVGKKLAIKTKAGEHAQQVPVVKGPKGFCEADFGEGPEETQMPNILFDLQPAHGKANAGMKRPASAKAKAKGKAKAKAKAVAKSGASSGDEDASNDSTDECLEEDCVAEEPAEYACPPKQDL